MTSSSFCFVLNFMQKSEKKQGASPKKKALQRNEQVAGRAGR